MHDAQSYIAVGIQPGKAIIDYGETPEGHVNLVNLIPSLKVLEGVSTKDLNFREGEFKTFTVLIDYQHRL